MSLWCQRCDNCIGNDRTKGRQWTISVPKTTASAAFFTLGPRFSRHYATICPLLWTKVAWQTTPTAGRGSGHDE